MKSYEKHPRHRRFVKIQNQNAPSFAHLIRLHYLQNISIVIIDRKKTNKQTNERTCKTQRLLRGIKKKITYDRIHPID